MIGCKFISPFTDPSGYSQSARNTLLAMVGAGIEVSTHLITSFGPTMSELGPGGRLALFLKDRPLDYQTRLIELTPNAFQHHLEPTKLHVGKTFWEVLGVDPRWVWNCNLMDEIWLSSKIHAETFEENGVKTPIVVIPECMEMDIPQYKILPRDHFIFYSIGQFTERKNQKGLVTTYWKTFQGRDDVKLILHTYRANFTEAEKNAVRSDVASWKKDQPQAHYPELILSLDGKTHEEMLMLHASCDCFVTSHRGEGWHYGAMEAMAFGKPVISTNFGGIHEWLTDKEAWLIPYKLIPVSGMPWIEFYHDDQLWADPDYEALSEMMVEAYEKAWLTKQKGELAQALVKAQFNYQTVGKIIKERLEKLGCA